MIIYYYLFLLFNFLTISSSFITIQKSTELNNTENHLGHIYIHLRDFNYNNRINQLRNNQNNHNNHNKNNHNNHNQINHNNNHNNHNNNNTINSNNTIINNNIHNNDTNSNNIIINFNNTKNYPHIFILGMQKTGTSNLYHLLTHHPQICHSLSKDTRFFLKEDLYKNGYEYYKNTFFGNESYCINKKEPNYFIDATPDYLTYVHDFLPRFIKTFNKYELNSKKFIISLIDPIYREYLWYNHLIKACGMFINNYIVEEIKSNSSVINNEGIPINGWNVTKICDSKFCSKFNCFKRAQFAKQNEEINSLYTFEEYFRRGKIRYETGKYIDLLQYLLKYIKRENIFIFNSDQIFNGNGIEVMSKLSKFLGIEDIYSNNTSINFPQYNQTYVSDFSCIVRKALYPLYNHATNKLYKYMEESQRIYNHEPKFIKFKEYRC